MEEENSGMQMLIGIAIGLIVLGCVVSLGPLIGHSMDDSIEVADNSSWSYDNMSAAGATGVDLWKDNISLMSLAVMVIILSVVIGYIMKMSGE